jgi:parallel beta-helix repeat protein
MRSMMLMTLLIYVAGVAAVSAGFAADLHVPGRYATIQDAINAALAGDVVVVAPDTYYENIDFLGKAITVRSDLGPAATIIDGNYGVSVVAFTNGEGRDSVIRGFTLTNSRASYLPGGGGVRCMNGSSPTITGNIIDGNDIGGALGGGIYCEGSSPIIDDNVIVNNSAAYGGGISCRGGSAPTIVGNIIADNTAISGGGGIECSDNLNQQPVIKGNVITGNVTTYNWSYGGGIYCAAGSAALISGNRISGNLAAHSGGGIHVNETSSVIENNVVEGNRAQAYGGGIGNTNYSTAVISGNVIAGNTAALDGGGIYAWYDIQTTVTGNTVVSNSCATHGGGVYCGGWSNVTITNSILWDNSASVGIEIYVGVYGSSGTCSIDFSDLDGGLGSVVVDGGVFNWGFNMYTIDPEFVDPAGSDYHLRFTSPVRNVGDGVAPGICSTDFEGDPRSVQGGVDLGADEFFYHLYHAGAVTPGAPFAFRAAGLPGLPVTLFYGSGVQDPPYPTPHGSFHLAWPVLWQGFIGTVPASGVLELPVMAPSAWNPGDRVPFQALIGPWNGLTTLFSNVEILSVE